MAGNYVMRFVTLHMDTIPRYYLSVAATAIAANSDLYQKIVFNCHFYFKLILLINIYLNESLLSDNK